MKLSERKNPSSSEKSRTMRENSAAATPSVWLASRRAACHAGVAPPPPTPRPATMRTSQIHGVGIRRRLIQRNAASCRRASSTAKPVLESRRSRAGGRMDLEGIFATRAAVPHLKKAAPAAIVNVASIAGILGLGSSIVYAASKAALINMTQALARTLGPEIRVNAVAPGAIDTRRLRRGLGEKGYEALVAGLATTPLVVISSADDVADAILWLAAGARLTTTANLIVDGRYHLRGR